MQHRIKWVIVLYTSSNDKFDWLNRNRFKYDLINQLKLQLMFILMHDYVHYA